MKTISSSLTMAVCATAVALAAGVQSGTSMDKPTMDMMKTTYAGCVQAVNHGGAFLLTRVSDGRMDAMHSETPMKHDAMTQKPDAGAMDQAATRMTPAAVVLSGRDLRKHAGQTVSVTGTLSKGSVGVARADLDTLTVSSLKVVAKACSQEGQ